MVEYEETEKGRRLMKEPIVAFAVVVHSSESDQKYTTVEPVPAPMAVSRADTGDGHSTDLYLPDDALHFELVPAPEGGYQVWGEINKKGDMDKLGVEYHGETTNPDWDEIIDKEWKE